MVKTNREPEHSLYKEFQELAFQLTAFILKPLNEEAIEKSKLIMTKISDDMINDILKEF